MHTFSYICIRYKIQIYIYKLICFITGHQSAFRESFGSERGFKARFASHLVHNGDSKRVSRVNLVQQSANHLFSSGLQSANHLIKFGTSERRARIIWLSSGLQSAERKSFASFRDFRAQSANHLIQFGTSERKSFGSVRDFRAQSANHLLHFATSERRAQIIWFSSGLQSANHLVQFGTSERESFD